MADILVILSYCEIVIVLLALLSNTLFTIMIHQASSLHNNCKGLLILFAISMYFLTFSHGMTVFEFVYAQQSYEFIYFVSERLAASICPTAHSSITVKAIIIILSFISIFISIGFTLEIHVNNQMFWPTLPMNFIDISGCIILLIAWKKSYHRYRTTVGIFSLEQRFQLSEVYTWSRHLIPAVFLASISKMIVMGVIWILITGNLKGNEAAIWLVVFNNVLNVYTVVLPFVILLKSKKIREKMVHHRKSPEIHMKTIDGKEIPCKHDYIEHLRERWK